MFLLHNQEAVRIAIPVLIAGLVRYFETRDTTPVWQAYAYSAAISFASVVLVFLNHHQNLLLQRLGWHLRVSSCALMYKKVNLIQQRNKQQSSETDQCDCFQTLRLSQKSINQTTTGQIVNLGATDVMIFDYFPMFLHYLWFAPVQCGVVAIILWQEVGFAALAGLVLLVAVMLLVTLNGRAFKKLRSKTAMLTDDRVRLMNEVMAGIRIIKMCAWEKPFSKLVSVARRKEVNKILLSSVLKAFNTTIFYCQDKVLTFVTLLTYTYLGETITASKIFIVVALFSSMRYPVYIGFSRAMQMTYEGGVSMTRIEKYLLLNEFSSNHTTESISIPSAFTELKNFTGKWDTGGDAKGRNEITLEDVSTRIEAGQLLAVIGPVGSGKSSFLNAILGELPPTSGSVAVHGRIVYANQVPWVFSGTIRDNILFGDVYDPVWYRKVITACCLTKDLSMFTEGDMTLVGERGVALSGGQKARVNLARAAYRRDSSICLMDDPLSAVNTSVANNIFRLCISGLMKDKVRVLVTHQLQLLKNADQIIILKQGKVAGRGTYDELRTKGTDFAALLQKNENDEIFDCELEGDVFPAPAIVRRSKSSKGCANGLSKNYLRASTRSFTGLSAEEIPADETFTQVEPEESREQGSVGGKIYLEYFRVGGNVLYLTIFLGVVIGSHVLYITIDWWLAQWALSYERYLNTSRSQNSSSYNTPPSSDGQFSVNSSTSPGTTNLNEYREFDTSYYLKIYAVFCGTMIAVILLRANMQYYLCVMSGIHMHKKMFRAILRAPVRFFDTNPIGRILNRFSKDMGQVDELLPAAFMEFLFICGVILSVIIMVSIINYFVIIIVIPLVVYFIWLRRYYLRTSRDIKRLEGTCRSPVFSLLSTTLQGLHTIRAFGAQNQLEEKFHESQDRHSASWFLFLVGSRWFGLRLDLITALFISLAAFACVIAASILNINSGEVGLILTYTASTLGLFQWGVRQSAEVENLMTSVERIQQYYHLSPEASDEIPENKPHKDWPTHGAITFKNVSFAYYKDGPTVLKSVNLEIRATEKVGIVGRTGAGKSSLVSALFRLAEGTEGEIFIDGIAINSIGLRDLRSVFSVIPQDPVLFTGTMRRNLDPFNDYSDADLWVALEQAELKEVVKALPLQLSTELTESGSNFSVGQRQLVCLARAVLRKSKILVIDEATANVDIRTDRMIQITLRENFKQCTVLIIAHRINTIVDCDRVVVLDSGRVKEFDEPHVLLRNKESHFSKMVNSTGIAESELLQKTAKEAYDTDKGNLNNSHSIDVSQNGRK